VQDTRTARCRPNGVGGQGRSQTRARCPPTRAASGTVRPTTRGPGVLPKSAPPESKITDIVRKNPAAYDAREAWPATCLPRRTCSAGHPPRRASSSAQQRWCHHARRRRRHQRQWQNSVPSASQSESPSRVPVAETAVRSRGRTRPLLVAERCPPDQKLTTPRRPAAHPHPHSHQTHLRLRPRSEPFS